MDNTLRSKRLRFIPFRKRDILAMCLQQQKLPAPEQFRQFYTLLDHVLSYEFHQLREALKDSYADIDPDADTRRSDSIPRDDGGNFSRQLQALLHQANYEVISQQDINQALQESSLFKIRLHVDFDDFSEVLLFCRGESIKQETVYRFLHWFPKTVQFINYDRVVIYIRPRDPANFAIAEASRGKTNVALLKLFQNVPKGDLEMLFPNTTIRMRTQDKLLIGIPAVVSGGIVLTTKVGASMLLLGSLMGFWLGLSDQAVSLNKTTILALLAGFGALAGYIWKQVSSFKNRKLRFMQSLTQNLYFKNLDNNAGVFHRLISDAEDEECKEALLAYYFLLINKKALSAIELDQQIEHWFEQQWQCQLNFEIDDALQKLLRLELITHQDNHYYPVSLNEAIKRLDHRWDNYVVTE